MASFYAKYPAAAQSSASVTTVQGEGTPGAQAGGIVTVQGDPSGTPIPISGNITASSASVGATGIAVPAQADYQGLNNAGTLIGAIGDTIGRTVVAGAGVAGTPAGGVVSIQGVVSGTAVPISGSVTVSGTVAATQSGTWNIATVTAVTAITNALPAGSAVIGKVSIDQTTPGTTNAVAVVSSVQPTTTTSVFQAEGAVAFGSVTASYVTLFTPSATTKIIQMRNNTNAAISVSFDAGTTTNYTLDSGDAVSLDLFSNGLVMSTTAIQVKYAVGAPTSGSFRINGGH